VSAELIVNGLIAAIERGDVDDVMSHLAEDCEWDNVPMGKIVGQQAIRKMMATSISPTTPGRFEVLHQVAAGDIVMNERIDKLEFAGKSVTIAVAGIFRVVDDRIVLWRDYFDLGQWQQQLK